MASLIKRGDVYHLQWYQGEKKRRKSLRTDSLQIAKQKLRQFESAQFQGHDCPLPTRTPVGEVVAAFVEHMKAHRPERSWKRDVSYLRELFGECCPELEIDSEKARKCQRLRLPDDKRKKLWPISAPCFEEITTGAISEFIAARVRIRGLAPKTANRYREVVNKVFNWAIESEKVRMPMDKNPAAKVARYKEHAWKISYLTLPQIDDQLKALEGKPQLRMMVAMLIYAGLRREELLWLTVDDVDTKPAARQIPMIRVQAKTIGGESWQPKTRVNRAIPISSTLAAILKEFQLRKSDHGWLFPSPTGTWWQPDNFAADLRKANRAGGLEWTCLDYRHTFGSQLAQRGISLYKIATLMGNSPEICRRHYAALIPEAMAEEVEFSLAKRTMPLC